MHLLPHVLLLFRWKNILQKQICSYSILTIYIYLSVQMKNKAANILITMCNVSCDLWIFVVHQWWFFATFFRVLFQFILYSCIAHWIYTKQRGIKNLQKKTRQKKSVEFKKNRVLYMFYEWVFVRCTICVIKVCRFFSSFFCSVKIYLLLFLLLLIFFPLFLMIMFNAIY